MGIKTLRHKVQEFELRWRWLDSDSNLFSYFRLIFIEFLFFSVISYVIRLYLNRLPPLSLLELGNLFFMLKKRSLVGQET